MHLWLTLYFHWAGLVYTQKEFSEEFTAIFLTILPISHAFYLSFIFKHFLKTFIDFRETGREKEREILMWDRNIDWLLPIHTPTGNWTCNLSMCPDWELNSHPFGVRDDTPTTEPHQPGLFGFKIFYSNVILFYIYF